MKEEEEKKNKVTEPPVEYAVPQGINDSYKTITISSFEEMRNDNYRHWLNLTPEQRLAEHYMLITRIYKDQLEQNNGPLYDKIYFHE